MPLHDDLEGCHRLIREMGQTLSEQSQRIERLEQTMQVFLHKLYRAWSVRHRPDQAILFDLEEEPAPRGTLASASIQPTQETRSTHTWPRSSS